MQNRINDIPEQTPQTYSFAAITLDPKGTSTSTMRLSDEDRHVQKRHLEFLSAAFATRDASFNVFQALAKEYGISIMKNTAANPFDDNAIAGVSNIGTESYYLYDTIDNIVIGIISLHSKQSNLTPNTEE